eukprot:2734625-Alexandrium_andersonii.AAC.1
MDTRASSLRSCCPQTSLIRGLRHARVEVAPPSGRQPFVADRAALHLPRDSRDSMKSPSDQ